MTCPVKEFNMYRSLTCSLLVLVSWPAFAADVGKAHTYKLADLSKASPVTVSTADVIVVIEEFKPEKVTDFKAVSDNPDVKVRAVAMDGELRIVITGDKKGNATVSWYFKVNDSNSGYKGLKIQIE